jgi:DeoR/GlpR family transcriptional regulator of sugar metabolism
MADVSREVIVLVESEKINRKIPNVEIPWKNIDILITDADLSDELKAKLLEQDVNLLIAK